MKRSIFALLLCLSGAGLALAQPQLSGNLSGNLGPGTYLVVGDIQVPTGQTLTIAPGTTFLHNGYRWWRIYGTLHAVGTATDSIKWLRQEALPEHRWAGLRFLPGAPAGSILSYCVVEYGYTPTTAPATDMGGCILANTVPLTVTHCRLSFGNAWWGGGGIYGYNVNGLTISDNLIADNWANAWRGGGIFLDNCTNAVVSHNIIARNKADGG